MRLSRRWFLVFTVAAFSAQSAAAQTGSIAGKVVAAATDSGVSAAKVAVMDGTWRQLRSVRTSDDGSFRVDSLRAGRYDVVVTAAGLHSTRIAGVRVDPGSIAQVDVRIQRSGEAHNREVLTASRSAQRLYDTPASVTIIDATELQRRPAFSLVDYLYGVRGVDVLRTGILGASVVTRGFNSPFSGALLMLQDDRYASLPSLEANVPAFITTTLEDIDRIEIVRGPASALYGPGAMNGVLNVVTKSPFSSRGTTLTVDGGSRSAVRGAVRHAGLLSPRVGYKLSGEYFSAREWSSTDPREPTVFPGTAPAERRWFPNQRQFGIDRFVGEARVDIRHGPNTEFTTALGLAHLENGLEHLPDEGTVQVNDWSFGSLQQRLRIGRLRAQLFANLHDAGNDTAATTSGTFRLRDGTPVVDRSRVFGAQVQYGGSLGTRTDLVYGLDFVRTEPRTAGTVHGRNEADDVIRQTGGYLQATTALQRQWNVAAAIRLDHHNLLDALQASPRVAVLFRPSASGSFRLSVNRAFAAPISSNWFADYLKTSNFSTARLDVRVLGNPPKEGWRFNRTCASAPGKLCMLSRDSGSKWIPSVAAPYFRGLVDSLELQIRNGLIGELQQLNYTQQKAVSLAQQVIGRMRQLAPTSADVPTRFRYIGQANFAESGTSVAEPTDDPGAIEDIASLRGGSSTTWEIGYQGTLGQRFRVEVDLWTEQRRGVPTALRVITPGVFFDKAALARYLATPIYNVLVDSAGMKPSQASSAAAAIASAQATRISGVPLGIVAVDGLGAAVSNQLTATYVEPPELRTVGGADVFLSYDATDRITVAGSYSYTAGGFMSDSNTVAIVPLNGPEHKASLWLRYHDSARGWGGDVRARYTNGYPFVAGVYSTRLTDGPTGENLFDPVLATNLVDVSVYWRVAGTGSRQLLLAVSADNVLDHRYRTMPGAPRIGRTVLARAQVTF